MAIANMKSLALTMLMVMASIILISENHKVSAQCQGSIPNLISKCSTFVQQTGPGNPPSADCCAVVMGLDIPCVCNLVTQAVENMISMDKAVYVGRTCGLSIQSGEKCGKNAVNSVSLNV
ncbi:hypothetical protein SO802_018429 [Lithocarpus litseifolius]|uniref:Bifunctional inhibitor/plant lipid transfer protein/seed storage helical domain-containing protein n=1 Tax=Lithocarpus litseifolius TaxID=425828 RepID=A0AAW2CL88_9ROSI